MMESEADERTLLLNAERRSSTQLPDRPTSTSAVDEASRDGDLLKHTSRLRRHSSSLLPEYHSHRSGDLRDDYGEESEGLSTLSIFTTVPVLLLGVFVANADGSLVIASSQHIASEFEQLSQASWLVTSYMLAQCASQPLYGKLSDIFGRKTNLITSYTLFALGCFLCGIGQSYGVVLAGRAISGVGGAGMTALISIIIVDLVPVRNVAAWRSYVNVAATVGRALGGPVGGWLTDTVGWRWSFFGQCPLTIIGLLLVLWKLPRSSSEDMDESLSHKFRRIDAVGALMLGASISAFLLALDFGASDSEWYFILTAGFCWVVFTILFVLAERKWAKEPILPIELITERDALTPYMIVGLQIAAQFAAFYAVPIYFQIVAGYTVTDAGLRLVPAVVGNAAGGLLSGYIITKTGFYKRLTIFASIAAAGGYVLMLIRWRGNTPWYEGLFIFPGGFGMGIIQSTTFIHLAASLPSDDMAIAGTTLYLAQNVFVLIGVQVATTILQGRVRVELDNSLNGDNKEELIEKAVSSVEFIRKLAPRLRNIVVQAYINGLTCIYALSFGLALAGGLIGLTIIERQL